MAGPGHPICRRTIPDLKPVPTTTKPTHKVGRPASEIIRQRHDNADNGNPDELQADIRFYRVSAHVLPVVLKTGLERGRDFNHF